MQIPHIVDRCEFGESYKKLNPTGRWKIYTTPHGRDIMMIEHQGLFGSTSWIHEKDIAFLSERNEYIHPSKEK
jgi:hypothetical protein